MPTYKVTRQFWEDGEEQITTDIFVISDTYAGLTDALEDDTAIEVSNDVFKRENTKHDVESASGESVDDELEFTIDETAAVTATDFNAIAFALAASVINKRFAGRIINPSTPIVDSDWDFRGPIVEEKTSDDVHWTSRTEYVPEFNPVGIWKCKADSVDAGYLLNRKLFKQKTDDDTEVDGLVDLLSTEWKEANIKDRLGYFEETTADEGGVSRLACWGNLVPMGELFNELLSLASSDGITMSFVRTGSGMRGAPARFRPYAHLVNPTIGSAYYRWTRFVNYFHPIGGYLWSYEVLDDLEPPPSTPDNYDVNYGGDGTAVGDLFVSSRMFIFNEDERAYSWVRYNTLRELLYAIAGDLNAFVTFEYTSATHIEVSFTPRTNLVSNDLFIKDGLQSSLSLRSEDRNAEVVKYVGVATPYTSEHPHVIYMYDEAGGYNPLSPNWHKPTGGTQTAVTLSPHTQYSAAGRGFDTIAIGRERKMTLIPHGAVFCHRSGGEIFRDSNANKPEHNRAVLHSGLYMRVPVHPADFGHNVSDEVTTVEPLARLSIVIDGTLQTFDRISDMRNTIYNREDKYYEFERTITVPGINCFRSVVDGTNSWKHARTLAKLEFDGIDYIVLGVQRNDYDTELRVQYYSRFDYEQATAIGAMQRQGATPPIITGSETVGEANIIYVTCAGAVSEFEAVSYEVDGRVIPSLPISTHVGQVAGIALADGIEDDVIPIQVSGRCNVSAVLGIAIAPGPVYVRAPSGGENISKTLLTAISTDPEEDSVIPIGTTDQTGILTIAMGQAIVLTT